MAPLEACDPVRLERPLRVARRLLSFNRGLQSAACRLELIARRLYPASELINDAGVRLFRSIQPFELSLQRLQRLNGGQVSFLGDPRLVLTFGQAEAYVGHRLLVTPARFARAKQRGAMRSVARFKLGDRLVRRHTFVVRGLLAGESLPELDHRLAPGIAGEAALLGLIGGVVIETFMVGQGVVLLAAVWAWLPGRGECGR